jgi:adenylate kinase family enzyme
MPVSPLRVLIVGNSGSGKSTYARLLADGHGLPHLELDNIVWEPEKIAVMREASETRADLDRFLATHESWVIEGCYGELIEAALPHCNELVFMNPGLEVCLENNRRRPWEGHKYASNSAQQRMLPALLEWVAAYYRRDDAWSYAHHRRLYDGFHGPKREIRQLGEDPRVSAPAAPAPRRPR